MESLIIKQKSILLLCPTNGVNGNYSTVERIRNHVISNGYSAMIQELKTLENNNNSKIYRSEAICVISIHALHSQSVLPALHEDVPFILVFGGTDLNHFTADASSLTVMTQVVQRADVCIAFSEELAEKARQNWADQVHKLQIIPQGVKTRPSEFDLRHYVSTEHNVPMKEFIVLVAGIRPVKDPLFLLPAFTEWHKKHKDLHLVIIGPKADEHYFTTFMTHIDKYKEAGVIYLGRLSQNECHAAIQQSKALINSSISEGLSIALLEAWDLHTPVIARNIPGNRSVIDHNENGLLYDSPEEFIKCLENVYLNSNIRDRIISNASQKLLTDFSYTKEQDLYKSLLDSICSST